MNGPRDGAAVLEIDGETGMSGDRLLLKVRGDPPRTSEELELPDTGSACDDFRAQIGGLGELLRGSRGKALAAMLGGARTDPELGRALGERWLAPRRRWGYARMMRAAAENELRPGVDPGAALSVLYGPLYAPLLFGGEVPDESAVRAYLDVACAGVFR